MTGVRRDYRLGLQCRTFDSQSESTLITSWTNLRGPLFVELLKADKSFNIDDASTLLMF